MKLDKDRFLKNATSSESAKGSKNTQGYVRMKRAKQKADKSENTTWRDKSNDIGERRDIQKISRYCQAIQTK